MLVKDVADRLNACGNGKLCENCKYKGYSNCEHYLIKEMAAEIEKIVAKETKKENKND